MTLYIFVDNPIDAAIKLNKDLSKIHAWSNTWLVTFNPSKTESMIFSRKLNNVNHPPIFMDQTNIKQVKTHKHLGITLSEDLRWNSHISVILQKAWKRIAIMRSLKFILNRASLEKMYISFIRPILEYADVTWDNCPNYLQNAIEAVQNEAARIITGATKLCNINKLLNDLKWETLTERRKQHKLVLFYKMVNGIAPQYLSNLVPHENADTSYNLRSQRTVPSRTQAYRSSFLPSAIREWNALPVQTRESPSISSFKHNLDRNKTKASPLFKVGSRLGQILHTRLRLDCSSLNYDLHRKSIVQSPRCACGAVETTNHYLLSCPLYNAIRRTLLHTLPCPPTVNNLLYGDERLSYHQNEQLFLKVQQFILASKRFTS